MIVYMPYWKMNGKYKVYKECYQKYDTTISAQLSLWDTGGSEVQYGGTIILSITNSLLYIEPLYLRTSGKTSIPEMKKIILSYNNELLMVDNIETGLQQIFNYTANQYVIIKLLQ